MSRSCRPVWCLWLLLAGCSSERWSALRGEATGPEAGARDGFDGRGPFVHPSHMGRPRRPSDVGDEVAADLAALAELRVHVEDQDGSAVQNAVVDVGGLSQGTDDNGDAVFSDLEADATLVVAAHADGFLSGVRRVEALDDGTVLVVPLTSTDAANVRTETHDTDEGAVTVEDDDSGFAVTLPGTLLDATGAIYDGPYTVLFATFKAHDDSSTDPLALSPGPLLTGADSGSTPDALQSLGMLYIELTADDTGAPLALGEPATVTRTLSDDELAEIDEAEADDDSGTLEWWHLDMSTGLWEAYGVDATRAGDTVLGDLPHFSYANLDFRWSSRCAKARVSLPAGLDRGAELHLSGGGVDTWLPVDEEMSLTGLPKADVQADLYVYDAWVDGPVDLDLGRWKAGLCKGSTPVELAYEAPASSAGSTVTVMARLRAQGCPAIASSVVFSAGGETWTAATQGGALASVALPEGTYDVIALDADGMPLGRDPAMVIAADPDDPTSPVLEELELSKADPLVPDGGCRPLPCQGTECDSAVHLSALDTSGALLPGARFSLDDRPVEATSGQVCVPIPDGADQTITVALDGGGSTQVTLPRGASCEAGTEAQVSLVSGASCPLDQTELMLETDLIGAEDPRFYDADRLDAPGAAGVGTLTLEARVEGCDVDLEDLPELGWEADGADSGTCGYHASLELEGVWGWTSAQQAADGSLTADALHLRAPWTCDGESCEVAGISLDIPLASDGTPPWGAWGEDTLADLGSNLRLTFQLLPRLTSDAYAEIIQKGDAFGYDLPMGLVDFEGASLGRTEDGALEVEMEGALFMAAPKRQSGLNRSVSSGFDLTLSGAWTVPLLDRSQLPQDLASAAARPVYGVRARIVRPEGGGMPYGPSEGSSDLLTCPVGEDPFYVVAEATPDAIPGISPLLVVEDGDVAMLGEKDGPTHEVFGVTTAMDSEHQAGALAPRDLGDLRISDEILAKIERGLIPPVPATYTRGGRLYAAFETQRLVQFAEYSSYNLGLGHLDGVPAEADLMAIDQSNLANNVVLTRGIDTSDFPPTLYLIDRPWLSALYAEEGLSDADLDRVASVLASPPECADGGCTFSLSLQDGTTCDGMPDADEGVSTTRAFLGLDAECAAATWDNPWMLTWVFDDSGARATALFLLEPGTALVLR